MFSWETTDVSDLCDPDSLALGVDVPSWDNTFNTFVGTETDSADDTIDAEAQMAIYDHHVSRYSVVSTTASTEAVTSELPAGWLLRAD